MQACIVCSHNYSFRYRENTDINTCAHVYMCICIRVYIYICVYIYMYLFLYRKIDMGTELDKDIVLDINSDR